MFIERSKNTRPHNWLIHHYCVRSVRKHASRLNGRVLDIGCGIKPYREIIGKYCTEYIGLDHPATLHGLREVEVVGDALGLPFGGESFDSVVSFQVMEHVREPQLFLSEAYRVMKRGGTALLTTPFMWGEHEQPHDYYRYTRYGLRYLVEKAGFEVIAIEPGTGYWSTAALRFNYWLNRFGKGPLRYLLMPVWLNQYLALWLDRVDRSYTVDTAMFACLLRKPELESRRPRQ
jgi:SAM-dependent methyltransferase